MRGSQDNKPEDKQANGVKDNHDGIYSRMMTKKQLAEMIFGVRELAKKLGSVKLKLQIQTVFILTKIYDRELLKKTRELTEWLLSKEQDVCYTVSVNLSQ